MRNKEKQHRLFGIAVLCIAALLALSDPVRIFAARRQEQLVFSRTDGHMGYGELRRLLGDRRSLIAAFGRSRAQDGKPVTDPDEIKALRKRYEELSQKVDNIFAAAYDRAFAAYREEHFTEEQSTLLDEITPRIDELDRQIGEIEEKYDAANDEEEAEALEDQLYALYEQVGSCAEQYDKLLTDTGWYEFVDKASYEDLKTWIDSCTQLTQKEKDRFWELYPIIQEMEKALDALDERFDNGEFDDNIDAYDEAVEQISDEDTEEEYDDLYEKSEYWYSPFLNEEEREEVRVCTEEINALGVHITDNFEQNLYALSAITDHYETLLAYAQERELKRYLPEHLSGEDMAAYRSLYGELYPVSAQIGILQEDLAGLEDEKGQEASALNDQINSLQEQMEKPYAAFTELLTKSGWYTYLEEETDRDLRSYVVLDTALTEEEKKEVYKAIDALQEATEKANRLMENYDTENPDNPVNKQIEAAVQELLYGDGEGPVQTYQKQIEKIGYCYGPFLTPEERVSVKDYADRIDNLAGLLFS